MMIQRENNPSNTAQHERLHTLTNEVYGVYELPYQPASSGSVGVVDTPPVAHAPTEQDAFQPPGYPPGPTASPPIPPRKRPGRAGAIMLLTLVLALIFSVGLFSGWEF